MFRRQEKLPGELAQLRIELGWEPKYLIQASVMNGDVAPDKEPILNTNFIWLAETGRHLTWVNAKIIADALNFGYRQNKNIEKDFTAQSIMEIFERDQQTLNPPLRKGARSRRPRTPRIQSIDDAQEDSIEGKIACA